jgi:hypothetical protein
VAADPDLAFDLVSTGWIRILPEPAYRSLTALQTLRRRPMAGDLDALVACERIALPAGCRLDAPFVPHGRLERADDDAHWVARWERFGELADECGMPMRTPRDAIAFLRAIGLAERVARDGVVHWRSVAPVPLAEDALPLSAAEREREARLRWVLAFAEAERRAAAWLGERRAGGGAPASTTLARLAARLRLDVDDARFGLTHAIEARGDVACVPDPELAAPGDRLVLVFAGASRRRAATAWRP